MEKNKKSNREYRRKLKLEMPHQLRTPNFKGTGIEIKAPFATSFGVVIDDSNYSADTSPIENRSNIMEDRERLRDSIQPTKDIGWNTPKRR